MFMSASVSQFLGKQSLWSVIIETVEENHGRCTIEY
jgi:hypothetical protein